MAANTEYIEAEEVVEIAETYNGEVLGTYYCIRDHQFEHWLNRESFSGEIWTKHFGLARKFRAKEHAEMYLSDLQIWRIGNERRR
jgi:hypothetical protein